VRGRVLIHPQYEAFYGSVERIGKSSVQTLFYQFLGFPLFPQGTYWVTGSALTSWSDVEVMELRRTPRSIVAAYARGWPAMIAFWCAVVAIVFWFLPGQQIYDGDPMPFGRSVVVTGAAGLALVALAVAIAAWLATRSPITGDELARRAVFARFLEVAVDPALLDSPWSARDDLKRMMADLANERGAFDRWPDIALSAEMRSPDYLRMALTVARLARAALETDEDEQPRRDPASLSQIEDRIWQKLLELDPSARTARPS
jgi:hypothetical protein